MKHLIEKGQMWHKYLPLATFVYNTFNSPNLANHSPYELVFRRKPKLLLDLETNPDIKIARSYKEYYTLLSKWLQYLHNILQEAKSKRLALMNKNRDYFQYNTGDVAYIISPLMSQLRTASRKVAIKYVGPLTLYKNYRPSQLAINHFDGKLLRGLYEHEWLKLSVIKKPREHDQSIKTETGNDFRILT